MIRYSRRSFRVQLRSVGTVVELTISFCIRCWFDVAVRTLKRNMIILLLSLQLLYKLRDKSKVFCG